MDLEKRVERLEKLHYYGGLTIIGLTIGFLIYKSLK